MTGWVVAKLPIILCTHHIVAAMVEEEKVAEEGGEKGGGEEGQEAGGEAAEGATGGAEINRETTEVSVWEGMGDQLGEIKCVCEEGWGRSALLKHQKIDMSIQVVSRCSTGHEP